MSQSVAIEIKKNIEWRFRTFTVRFWRFEFRVYFKWDLWVKKYHYYNTGKMAGRKGFVLMAWPFAFTYQVY